MGGGRCGKRLKSAPPGLGGESATMIEPSWLSLLVAAEVLAVTPGGDAAPVLRTPPAPPR